jgi:hypothetical protein
MKQLATAVGRLDGSIHSPFPLHAVRHSRGRVGVVWYETFSRTSMYPRCACEALMFVEEMKRRHVSDTHRSIRSDGVSVKGRPTRLTERS